MTPSPSLLRLRWFRPFVVRLKPRSFMPAQGRDVGLLSLPDELLTQIVSHCSVDDVSSAEKACKRLRKACNSRSIWSKLLIDAPLQHSPDLPLGVSIDDLPASTLKTAVTHAIGRHKVWSNVSEIHKLEVLDLPFPASTLLEEGVAEPRILPGGRHMLLLKERQLQLWSMQPHECVWMAPRCIGDETCMAYDFEVFDEGRKLRVATVDVDEESRANVCVATSLDLLLSFSDIHPRTKMRVMTYDMAQGTHSVDFENLVPLVFLFQMKLCGDYVFSPILPDESRAMLLNWRTRERLVMQLNDAEEQITLRPRAFVLTPECIVAVLKLRDTGFSAVAFPLTTFAKLFTVSTGWDHQSWLESTVSIDTTDEDATVLALPFESQDTSPGTEDTVLTDRSNMAPVVLATRSFVSSWMPQKPTEIILAAFDGSANEIDSTQLLSYHIRITPRDASRPQRSSRPLLSLMAHRNVTASKLPWNPRSLSNNGHMFFQADKLRCFALFEDSAQPVKEIDVSPEIIPFRQYVGAVMSAVEPWSGSIVLWMDGKVKVVRVLPA